MNLKIEVTGSLNGVMAHGSPTADVKRAIVNSMCNATPRLQPIDRLVIVDDTNTERDSMTSLTRATTADELKITATYTATASYTATKIRAYSGTTLYFETALATAVSVTAGNNYYVELKVKGSMAGSGIQYYDFAEDKFIDNFIAVLAGAQSDQSILANEVYILIERTGGGYRTKTAPTTRTATATKCTAAGSIVIEAGDDGAILAYSLRNPNNESLYSYAVSEANKPHAISVLPNDKVNVSIELNV